MIFSSMEPMFSEADRSKRGFFSLPKIFDFKLIHFLKKKLTKRTREEFRHLLRSQSNLNVAKDSYGSVEFRVSTSASGNSSDLIDQEVYDEKIRQNRLSRRIRKIAGKTARFLGQGAQLLGPGPYLDVISIDSQYYSSYGSPTSGYYGNCTYGIANYRYY